VGFESRDERKDFANVSSVMVAVVGVDIYLGDWRLKIAGVDVQLLAPQK